MADPGEAPGGPPAPPSVWDGGRARGGGLDGLRPAAVVFDCDGLLLDTEPCWTVVETEIFARRGLPYGPAEKARFIGRSVPGSAELMAVIFGEAGNEEAILAEILAMIGEVVEAEAEPMAGAVELVASLGERLPLAVASNSPRAVLDAALRRAGLGAAFTAIVAADEVPEPKPAPDLYLQACRLLGVRPSAALAFEDTATGAASARAAGLRVVAIPSPEAGDFPADAVFASLADPALRAWASAL